MMINDNELKQQYECLSCDYFTNKKSNYERHMISFKHKNNIKSAQKIYECEICQKTYNNYNSLWKHNKNYHPDLNNLQINNPSVINLLNKLVDTTRTLALNRMETPNISNNGNNNINNSNNRFNINFYLNDTCKNAMNINEFSDSINVTMDDLEQTSKLGFVDGISRIIIKNLKEIDESDRPMHCSDSKRVILYIKSDDSWSKNNNEKLVTLIKNVAGKNMKQIYEWQKLNPNYSDPTSNCSDKYQHMLFQVMSGDSIEECNSNIDKIIKNIAKETIISKEKYS